jgi:hypothetical protein
MCFDDYMHMVTTLSRVSDGHLHMNRLLNFYEPRAQRRRQFDLVLSLGSGRKCTLPNPLTPVDT